MPRPPGLPKTGGRKKGVKNKVNRHLAEVIGELQCNPFEVLIHFAKGDWKALGYTSPVVEKPGGITEDVIPAIARLKAAIEACKYVYAQKKTIDSTQEITPEEQIFLNIFRERMAEYAAKTVIEDSSEAVTRDHTESDPEDQDA